MNKSLRKPKFRRISADININVLPVKLKKAMQRAIDLVQRYELPCDVAVTDIENTTARHLWYKNGTCVIQLSFALVCNADARAIHRRIIHEAAHHIAGRNHLDHADEHFREVAADLYEREGFPRGMPSDGCGNM
jgi:hypothetical protein